MDTQKPRQGKDTMENPIKRFNHSVDKLTESIDLIKDEIGAVDAWWNNQKFWQRVVYRVGWFLIDTWEKIPTWWGSIKSWWGSIKYWWNDLT